jgi:SAM-dependent methyltransferase
MSWKRIGAAWREGGPRRAVRVFADRIGDFWWEKRTGIDTGGLIPIETLVTRWDGFHDYFPSSRRTFHRLMQYVDIRPGRDVFLDIGSGKGRALLMAAQYPFKRCVGIEISAELNAAARRNIARWSGRLACPRIEICTCDAAHFPIPDDATVLYFYNPFHGPTLHAVFGAIARSQANAPRRLSILFNNTRHFRALESSFPWLQPLARPTFDHACAIYVVEAVAGFHAANTSTVPSGAG